MRGNAAAVAARTAGWRWRQVKRWLRAPQRRRAAQVRAQNAAQAQERAAGAAASLGRIVTADGAGVRRMLCNAVSRGAADVNNAGEN